MRTIMVLNAKGGSGKTTLATNIAGYYAAQDKVVVIKDHDPQASSTEWLEQRNFSLPTIHGLTAYKPASQYTTMVWQMRLPKNTDRVVLDTAAGIDLRHYVSALKSVNKIIIPVSDSAIDIRATIKFIEALKKFLKLYPCQAEIGIVANRVDIESDSYRSMCAIFSKLKLDIVANLSLSDIYIKSAECGVSVLEFDHPALAKDKFEWAPLINWLEDDVVMKQPAEEPKLYAVVD